MKDEITAEIALEWDPEEISQILHEEEVLNNPLTPIAQGLNNLGRSAVRLTEAASSWADEMERLCKTLEEVIKVTSGSELNI